MEPDLFKLLMKRDNESCKILIKAQFQRRRAWNYKLHSCQHEEEYIQLKKRLVLFSSATLLSFKVFYERKRNSKRGS
jgi:hypothetical protein